MANEPMRAQEFLNIASDIALEIGLHRRDFAILRGKSVQAIEESWRRTWWELYPIDVMFAALEQKTNARLWNVNSNVLLPCDEIVYREQNILPPPNTLTDLDRRFFADKDVEYSSFCYRIAAVRILGRIVSITNGKAVQQLSLHREVELLLENLALHLPKQMQTNLGANGEVDEMLFQTHMILHALHRPQSALSTPTASHTIACAPRGTSLHFYHIAHLTKKTMDAADEICQMIPIPSPLLSRTPFFTCALGLQALVRLGACGLLQWNRNKSLMKQQIQTSIGALKRLGEVWEIANVILSQIKDVARDVLDIPRESSVQHGKANGAATQLRLEQSGLEDTSSFDFETLTQGNDNDFWMESFLNQSTMD